MQNFNDILNGVTDGTKNLSISALTVSGVGTFNGAVNLGSASDDDLTFNGSLASTIPIKTTATYNIGSATLGLLSVYIGGTSSFTTRILTAATSSYSLTLPVDAGTAGYVLRNTGSASLEWALPVDDSPSLLSNYSLSCTVGSSALTIALKTQDGGDPASTDVCQFAFRNATAATGDYTVVSVTAATSLVISSGSTLGHESGVNNYIYVYALNNSGTVELAASTYLFDDSSIQSTTAEGGSGGADSASTLYSTTSRSNKAIRLLGRLTSAQVTAGTWAAVPTEVSLGKTSLPSIRSGTYTPTSSNTVNVASITEGAAHWVLIGNICHVNGTITIDPTAAAPTSTAYQLTLPVSSNLTASSDLSGVSSGQSGGSTGYQGGTIEGNTSNNTASFNFSANDTSAQPHLYTYSYVVK